MLPQSSRRSHLAVQLPRKPAEEAYLAEYFDGMNVKVFWGDVGDFIGELHQRWKGNLANARG
jgi:hypothetical protein